jgi:magnesium chelatase subunit D
MTIAPDPVPSGQPMTPWVRGLWAAHLAAVDPHGLGGVLVRSGAGPVRDLWLEELTLACGGAPLAKVPSGVDDQRLLGGLDLTATLATGRPVLQHGLLAQADCALLVVVMAERLSPGLAARMASVLDRGSVAVERDGLSAVHPARTGLVLLDEGQGDEERTPDALSERCGLWIGLDGVSVRDCVGGIDLVLALAQARDRLRLVAPASPARIEALCATAAAFGITSPRAVLFAMRAARALCACAGRTAINDDDIGLAAAIVLAPRATCLPPQPEDSEGEEAPPPPPEASSDAEPVDRSQDAPLEDQVLDATRAALPQDLLAALSAGAIRTPSRRDAQGSGARLKSLRRGRAVGTRSGQPGGGHRLALVESLRAAAPWQKVRTREAVAAGRDGHRIHMRLSDLQVRRHESRTSSTIIFCVDASGSAAFARLAEVKGAVELVLGQAYAARTQVALVAFRGTGAEVLVPPTRSLVRARRLLSSLPGGGPTPLVAGIEAAVALGLAEKAKGNTPLILLLSDGRGNVARDGTPGRALAAADLKDTTARTARAGVAMVLVDTARWPGQETQALAASMGARYVPLPFADSAAMGALAGSLTGSSPSPEVPA